MALTDYDDDGLTSFADLDMIKMDNIGSVADILGPDSYLPEISITMNERPDSSSREERVEVDGQTFLSFASAEEMHEYIVHREARSKLTKTTDFKQIKGWQTKFHQLNELTPSVSPSPCPSPTLSSSQSASNVAPSSEFPTAMVSSESMDLPVPYVEAEDQDEVTIFEVIHTDGASSACLKEESTSEELAEIIPVLGSDGLISEEYATWAVTALKKNLTEKTLNVQKESEKVKEIRQSPSQTNASIVQTRAVTSPGRRPEKKQDKMRVELKSTLTSDVDEIPNAEVNVCSDSSDDVIVQEDEYEEVYGKSALISYSSGY